MKGRYNVAYSDINELAYPVLRHRLKLTFEAIAERVSPDDIIKMIIDELAAKNKIGGETAVETAVETAEVAAEEKESKKRLFGRK